MAGPWRIEIYKRNQLLHACEAPAEPLELGRQQKEEGEDGPPAQLVKDGVRRLIVARWDEQDVSRRHADLRPAGDGRVAVANVSQRQPLHLPNRPPLLPAASCEADLPLLLSLGSLGETSVRLAEASDDDESLFCLKEASVPPGGEGAAAPELLTLVAGVPPVQMDNVLQWLRTAMDVLRGAAGAEDFFGRAARAVVDSVGLDFGRVLLLLEGVWKMVAAYPPSTASAAPPEPSRTVLDRVVRQKRTFWQTPLTDSIGRSLFEGQAVVAAPLLNRHGAVLGVLYGDRRSQYAALRPPTQLEAELVELLAGAAAAGLARVEQERAAAAMRVQFEQFFAPDLAHQLLTRPDLLTGRIAEVSILFCDIRNYSGISRRLTPEENVAWVRAVLGATSECVLAEGGVLVDYIGDAVMAMWGAPREQPDHCERAGRAALAMLARVPELNARWQETLGEPTRLGVGVNAGKALVGNTGSKYKFKYGALGHEVNMASRVQGATKYFKTDLLVTEATRLGLGAAFAIRRLSAVHVTNIKDSVMLYELSAGGPDWADRAARYERALEDFEAQRFRPAARALGDLLAAHPDDGPAVLLLSRAVQCMVEAPDPFDPVWTLPGK